MPSRRPWLRLYTSWRTDERVQGLSYREQAAAINLLCLACESTRQGHIEMSPGVPYPPSRLAHALNLHPSVVHSVLTTLVTQGVFGLRVEGDGTLTLDKWQEAQPHDPTAQQRVARYRSNLDNRNTERNNPRNTTVTPGVTVTPESRVEKNKKKNRIEKVQEKIPKKPYGEFLNVLLSEKDYESLITRFGEQETLQKIEALSEGIASKGYKYKDHYATILSWARKDAKEVTHNGNGHGGANANRAIPGNEPAGAFADIELD